MKKLIEVLLISFIVVSCKKPTDSSTQSSPTQTISFKINGVYKEYSAKDNHFICSNESINGPYYGYKIIYGFGADNGSSTNYEGVGFYIVSNNTTLTVGNYNINSPVRVSFANGASSRMYIAVYRTKKLIAVNPDVYDEKIYKDETGDFSKVSITEINSGYISGTFSTSVTKEGGTERLSLTEGKFSNFKMQ